MNDLTERLRRAGAILDQASEGQGVRLTPPVTHGPPGRQAPPSTTEDSGPYITRSEPDHGSSRKLRLAIAAAAVVLIAGGTYLGTHRPGPPQRSLHGPVEIAPTVRRNGNTTVLRVPGRSVELWISPNPAAPKTGTCGNDIASDSTSQQCGIYGQNQLSGLFRTRDLPHGATKASRYLQIINLDRRITRVQVRDGSRTMYETPTAGAALFPLNGPYPGFTMTGTDRRNHVIFRSHPN